MIVTKSECQNFLSECMDYIEYKKKAVDILNLEFVLENCNEEGLFTARDDKKKHKRFLDTLINEHISDIEKCKK